MTSASLTLVSHSHRETQEVGRLLGSEAQGGEVFLLTGALGTGKTCLIQGIAWGLGVKEYARSPTFILVAQYMGRLPLYHIDLFRIGDIREALGLGLEELLWGDGVCAVEWAEKAPDPFPREHIWIELSYRRLETERRIRLVARGRRYRGMLGRLVPALRAAVKGGAGAPGH